MNHQRVISCRRPRSAYQVIRFVEGHKLMVTCTKRGIVSLWRLEVRGDEERPVRITDSEEKSEAIERAVNAGYNMVEMVNRLLSEASR